MCDSASESDASSVDGLPSLRSSLVTREQLQRRTDSLQQENCVLKTEVETLKLKLKALQEENHQLRRNSVSIQAKAEQEEEYISNTLLKKITELKKEKESLALNYEQEEEYLTNDLSRKLCQLRQEKVALEHTLEREQEAQVTKLMRRIEKLETDVVAKQASLDRLRREKVELENCLEQEQESLVNRLWKKMEKLEAEKKMLQEKLDISSSPAASPAHSMQDNSAVCGPQVRMEVGRCDDQTELMTDYVRQLRAEVERLRGQMLTTREERTTQMGQLEREERQLVDENLRLKKRLQLEVERRQELRRHLSESESSLEMDDERHFNEANRSRTISSPLLASNPGRPSSPLNASNSMRCCRECGQLLAHLAPYQQSSSSPNSLTRVPGGSSHTPLIIYPPGPNTTNSQSHTFVKPSPPTPGLPPLPPTAK